jgi:hypothetical protein
MTPSTNDVLDPHMMQAMSPLLEYGREISRNESAT